jgi:hypothetical protein
MFEAVRRLREWFIAGPDNKPRPVRNRKGAEPVKLSEERLIRFAPVDTKSNYLNGFWRWVEVLAGGDYQHALQALHWPQGTTWTPEAFQNRITTFFGGDAPWSVVVPNERLIEVINDATKYEPQNQQGWGWFMAHIPLTTEPADPKRDDIPLMGLATSFLVRDVRGCYVLEFEVFHA